MTDRKIAIKKLESLIQIKNSIVTTSNIKGVLLPNIHTHDLCQIIECFHDPDSDDNISFSELDHKHENSYETFYQLAGTLTFSDGVVLNKGEFRIIPPNIKHSYKISKTGFCIIIIHPPINELEEKL